MILRALPWAIVLGLTVPLASGALPAAASGFAQVGRLAATQPKKGDVFGAAVAVGGGVIAVGAYLSDVNGKDSGAVYLFRKVAETETWIPFEGMPRHGDAGEWFGFDVAIDPTGKVLVVGAPSPGRGTGAVYLFDLDGGNGRASNKRRLAATASSGDEFGSAVAINGTIDGSYLAVGARGAGQRAGKLHLFWKAGNGWAPVELPGLPSVAGAELGQSVSVRGNTLAVGAPLGGPGAAYRLDLQRKTTWEPLVPAGLEAGAAFGYSVSVVDGQKGDVVIGAPLANAQAGAVYLYPAGRGQPFRVGSQRDQAGVAVAASGGRIVAGARYANGKRGAADLFNDQGSFIQPLAVSPPPEEAELGFSVAIHDRTIVVGAFKENGGTGAAYVFQLQESQTVSLSFQENEAGAALQAKTKTMVSRVREGEAIPVSVVITTSDGQSLQTPVTVTVSAAPINAELGSDYGATEDLAQGKATVQFDAKDPDGQKKPVPFSVLPDCLAEGEEAFTLSLSEPLGAEVIDPVELRVRIQDVGAADGIDVILPGPGPLITTESGSEATFRIRLTCEPTEDVFLTLTSSDPSEGKVTRPSSPPFLTFTSDDWSVPQPVTVKGQDDSECDGDQDYEIGIGSASADPGYSGLPREVSFTNLDDGDLCPGAEATMSVCVEGDGTVVYTLEVKNTGNVDLRRSGLEILAELPVEVTVVTASADKGVATVDHLENEVAWNGSIPVDDDTVKIQILATLEPDVTPGATVEFSGTYRYNDVEEDGEDFAASFVVGEASSCLPPP